MSDVFTPVMPVTGMWGTGVTVNVAVLELTEPWELVATARYWLPFMPRVTPVSVSVAEVAPATLVQPLPVLTCHWNVGAGTPEATVVKVALLPACTLWFAGCVVIIGA